MSKHTQRGDFLIEALIGLVLMAVVGTGVVYVTSRVEVSKRNMAVQEIAVNKLRTLLMSNGVNGFNLCASTLTVAQRTITLPSGNVTFDVTGCEPTTTQVNGVSVTGFQKPLVLSIFSGENKISVGGVSSAQ